LNVPDTQSLADDAWAELVAIDSAVSNYRIIKRLEAYIRENTPLYQSFHTEADIFRMAFQSVRQPHPMIEALSKEFDRYQGRQFQRMDGRELVEEPVREMKRTRFMNMWISLLDDNMLGVSFEFINKPEKREDILDDVFRWIDVFESPPVDDNGDPIGSPPLEFEDIIKALAHGIKSDPDQIGAGDVAFETPFTSVNNLVAGIWHQVKMGADSQYRSLLLYYDAVKRIPVFSISVPYVWADVKTNFEIRKFERLPEVGTIDFPVLGLHDTDWNSKSPWYVDPVRGIKIFKPFNVVTTIQREARS
jgi:hypothetical protein